GKFSNAQTLVSVREFEHLPAIARNERAADTDWFPVELFYPFLRAELAFVHEQDRSWRAGCVANADHRIRLRVHDTGKRGCTVIPHAGAGRPLPPREDNTTHRDRDHEHDRDRREETSVPSRHRVPADEEWIAVSFWLRLRRWHGTPPQSWRV